jgi:sirohydrochlorin cobaltochelatase
MLILIAHGSKNARWRASVERVVTSLEEELGEASVALAYMELSPPTLLDVASEAVSRGVTTLGVLPLFLADEGHVERDVRPLVDDVRRALPQATIELLPALGQHPEFRDGLARITRRSLEGEVGVSAGEGALESDARPRPGRWGWWAP